MLQLKEFSQLHQLFELAYVHQQVLRQWNVSFPKVA